MSTQETTHKVQNWSEYNDALVQRGSLTVWISEEAIENWEYDGPAQQGAQYEYTDLAIRTCFQVKLVYGLTLRQVEGFVESVFDLMDVDLDAPDYSTLSKREGDVEVDVRAGGGVESGLRHLVIDSTGLKVYGEGEWKQRAHGKQKRRTWRKLHLGIDADTGEVTAATLTDNTEGDASQVSRILEATEGPVHTVGADGAYDTWDVHEDIADREATPVIPPRKNAKIKKHGNCNGSPLARDEALRYIRSHGRAKWKREHDYHKRSLAETGVYRFKQLVGRFMEARDWANEKVEAKIGANVLNKMTQLGMPETVQVAV
jgi:hypothetical protein